MLQAVIKKGKVLAEKMPIPKIDKNGIKIRVANSCISAGTELSSVNNSGKSLLEKAKEKPEKIQKVIDKVKAHGIDGARNFVDSELNAYHSIGYSVAGIVEEVGENIQTIKVGDRVAAAGAGKANHAEYVVVPENLVCKISDNISFENASTVALGAISMQGVRRAGLYLGERAVVFGTGIMGLITVQLLRSSGVRVVAIDVNDNRLAIAKELGAEIIINAKDNPVNTVLNWSGGIGADAVLFTAATSSNEPLAQAFQMCRRKGKVIMVGVADMHITREDFYPKELDFKISTSYGPGRYDKQYEEEGIDYPISYVRWTEKRNMEEFLRLISVGAIDMNKITTHRFEISDVEKAYAVLKDQSVDSLIVTLSYGNNENIDGQIDISSALSQKLDKGSSVKLALIGAGNFAKGMHLPNITKLKDKFTLHAVVSNDGARGKAIAESYGAKYVTSNIDDVLTDEEVDLVFICTRHENHGSLVLKALQKGKNVFVEKPLTVNTEELNAIKEFYLNESSVEKPLLMVGYNRRFSKYIKEIRRHTDNRINPLIINYRMNAGYIPYDHWVHESGGRIIGEACHIIDLFSSLVNAPIESISCENISPKNDMYKESDNKIFLIKYTDGSLATLSYFSTGAKSVSKEYMEVHFDGKSIIMDDYKSMKGFGGNIKSITSSINDKGHLEELNALYDSLAGRKTSWPIDLRSLLETSEATLLDYSK